MRVGDKTDTNIPLALDPKPQNKKRQMIKPEL